MKERLGGPLDQLRRAAKEAARAAVVAGSLAGPMAVSADAAPQQSASISLQRPEKASRLPTPEEQKEITEDIRSTVQKTLEIANLYIEGYVSEDYNREEVQKVVLEMREECKTFERIANGEINARLENDPELNRDLDRVFGNDGIWIQSRAAANTFRKIERRMKWIAMNLQGTAEQQALAVRIQKDIEEETKRLKTITFK